ncbi:unnamed protein product, partial [marine sediment metagenome]
RNSCCFWGGDIEREPLENRFFFYGVWDCFALVRDYFHLKFDINLPNIPREFGFWYKGISVFEKHLNSSDFGVYPVPIDNIKKGDILLYNMHGTKYINHCAICLEDGLVFHHFNNKISKPFPISHYQQFLYPLAYRIGESK